MKLLQADLLAEEALLPELVGDLRLASLLLVAQTEAVKTEDKMRK
jgi:hypothetical protein